MTETTQDDQIAAILADPFSRYATPIKVVNDDTLSIEQKRRILDAMEHDARELATAATENMTGGETIPLDAILEAKRKLPQ